MRIKGLELSKKYYKMYGESLIHNQFPEYTKYMAVGLVGEGSECFGFDDSISEDHDYGPGFCIWLPQHIYNAVGHQIQEAYNNLPKELDGISKIETINSTKRTGVFSIENFYYNFIGIDSLPINDLDWLKASESSFSVAVNGEVFFDNLGEFTQIRDRILKYYPYDIFLKKIATRLAKISQSGQYNYPRCIKRENFDAAYLSCNEFVKATISLGYILNRLYMPFYKWSFKGMDNFRVLKDLKEMLNKIILLPDLPSNANAKINMIESVCIYILEELKKQNLTNINEPFLNVHCPIIMNKINDNTIKSLPILFDAPY